MTTNTDMVQKQCRTCCMMIPEQAKRCPYCQTFQKWWIWHVQHPLFLFVMMGVLLTFAMMPVAYLSHTFGRGEPFEPYRSQVMVVESELAFGERVGPNGVKVPIVEIIGTIRNDSSIPWQDVRFGVEFFDEEGTRIDASSHGLSQHTFVLAPHETVPFKLPFDRHADRVYASHHITITHARDVRSILLF